MLVYNKSICWTINNSKLCLGEQTRIEESFSPRTSPRQRTDKKCLEEITS